MIRENSCNTNHGEYFYFVTKKLRQREIKKSSVLGSTELAEVPVIVWKECL
jgi:hypothetical protein